MTNEMIMTGTATGARLTMTGLLEVSRRDEHGTLTVEVSHQQSLEGWLQAMLEGGDKTAHLRAAGQWRASGSAAEHEVLALESWDMFDGVGSWLVTVHLDGQPAADVGYLSRSQVREMYDRLAAGLRLVG